MKLTWPFSFSLLKNVLHIHMVLFIKEIYLHVNKHIFVMFWEKNPTDFYLLSKKWKTPKYLQNGHMHRKSNLKVFLEKTLLNCSWCTFLKHKIYSSVFLQLSMFPNLASEMLGTSYPSKKLKGRNKEGGRFRDKRLKKWDCQGIVNEFPILESALSDSTGYYDSLAPWKASFQNSW